MEFETSLVYRVRARTAREKQRSPVLRKSKRKRKRNRKEKKKKISGKLIKIENILNEVTQTHKDKCHVVSLM